VVRALHLYVPPSPLAGSVAINVTQLRAKVLLDGLYRQLDPLNYAVMPGRQHKEVKEGVTNDII
jgi:hypothetical protein